VNSTNLIVRGNYSHHNLGPGLWTDINNIYTLYENNTVEDNERSGIFIELSYDTIVRYNTARRNGTEAFWYYWTAGAGIEILTAPNVEVYGNVLEDNWNGITALNDPSRGSGLYGPWVLKNLYVHDNTVTSRLVPEGIGRSGIVDAVGSSGFAASSNNRFRHNTYNLGSKAHYFIWQGERDENEWRASGQDTDGTFRR
jgi:parallel beta-helix repeat protein